MNLYISTNLLEKRERSIIYRLRQQFEQNNLGIEIFPHFHEEGYDSVLAEAYLAFRGVPMTFHEQYYESEHTAPRGTAEYARSMDYFKRTLAWAAQFEAKHLVYHFNNGAVSEKDRMRECAWENLQELRTLADQHGQTLLIENTGVLPVGNVLFDQNEFIDLFEDTDLNCLFDIGHAHCNGWDFETVLSRLGGRIRSYHLHNNRRENDVHNRLTDGTLEVENFFRLYGMYTPEARLVMEYNPRLMGDYEILEQDIESIYTRIKLHRQVSVA